jgi:hypothetical protein
MKPTLTRRHRRRSTSTKSDGAFFKKESQQEQSFFGEASHDAFFPPAATQATAIQRKCDNCEEDKKVQRAEDKKEEEKKVMKKEDKKEEEKVMKKEDKKEEEKVMRAADKKEEEKVMKKEDKKEEEKVMKKEDKKEEEKVMKMGDKKEEEKVQKKETGASSAPGNKVSNYISSLNGKGNPLPAQANHFFSSKMGYDFSGVKVHTDKEAAESAKGINAKAYTIGNNVVFNEGQYNTESGEGKKLMAHELTHVVQQKQLIQCRPEEDTIPPLWDKVSSEYSSLMVDMAVVNQKYPAVERQRLNSKLFSYSAMIGGPGDKTDSELIVLDQNLKKIRKEIEILNQQSLRQWAGLIKSYDKEKKELSPFIDDPISVKAEAILEDEFTNTFKKVVNAENFLVYEDLMSLDYMLKNNKHLEWAQLFIERNKFDRGEVPVKGKEDEFLENTGHVSVSVGSTMTSEAGLREVYQKGAKEITLDGLKAVKKGVPVENVARWAHQARNDLKVLIRSKGSSIVRGLAEARNIRKYGNAVGPAYEELIKKGKTPMDIIGSAGKSSAKVNKGVSKLKVGGRFFILIDLAIVTWDVFTAPEGQRLKAFVKGAAGIGGAVAGGWAGAKAGGAAGSFFGPVGTGVGGFLGLIGGAIIGGWAGSEVAGGVYDLVDELVNPKSDWEVYCDAINEIENDKILKGK